MQRNLVNGGHGRNYLPYYLNISMDTCLFFCDQILVRYRDIQLTMTERLDQCLDWLLLQSLGHHSSAAMTCGHLSSSDRVISSRGHQLLLHFHTQESRDQHPGNGRHDNEMRGFRIFLQGK